ncbi:ras association domain-containing protein 10 [Clarias gariepinus]|uniref:ras association domain-containing protein 10 n=1 Tax=Clarias gariepinus TaxID=13013 RepID=UPI00234E051F|nr:ras association domain-containing protein 10 [Clarias gariepinus]
MEDEESRISVWVCREEKLVSGLSKRTTCADVIKVLLEEQNSQGRASASARAYCIVEKWRGFERVLPNKTKILRLWNAWGEEQENVCFVLVKQDASLASSAPRSAEARLVPSRQNLCVREGNVRQATMGLSPEKQRRVVRKAFRKLERINKKRAKAQCKDAERMETLVHLVVSQDHTIRQQVERIQELDREIELYEAKVHLDRVRTHGANYVQETYLVEGAPYKHPCPVDGEQTVAQLEEYARKCEEVIRLQEDLTERQVLLDSITRDIQEELNQRWMKRRQDELANKDCENNIALREINETWKINECEMPPKDDPLLEEERIRTQLDASLYIGLRLNTDLEAVRNDLDLTQDIWRARDKELRDLLEKVDSLDLEEDKEGDGCDVLKDTDRLDEDAESRHGAWVEQARGLAAKACSTNDDDSDTGLSSMHSQDSDIAPVFESLV